MRINGLGGETFIIGVLPEYPIMFGTRIITKMIGITDNGSFEMLLGNDSIAELELKHIGPLRLDGRRI